MRFSSRVRSKSALIGVFAALAAQVGAQPLPDRAEYRGQVLNAAGLPIGGAAVTLRRQNDVGSMAYWGGAFSTDARGAFDFPDAETGSYYLSIEADGFAPIQNKTVQIGLTNPAETFRLQQLASFRTKILDSAGAPLKNSAVSVAMKLSASRTDGYWRMVRVRTDEQGMAEFSSLLPEKYDILGVSPGNGYVEIQNLEFVPGKNPTPFTWKLSAGATMKVVVKNAAGKELGGIPLVFGRAGDATPDAPRQFPGPEVQIYGNRAQFVSRDGDGTLEINDLAPGRYRVATNVAGVPENAPAQEVTLEAGKTLDLTFAVEPPVKETLAVKIVDGKGAPRANSAFLLVLSPTGEGGITRPNAPNPLIQSRGERRIRTDENGLATLFPVPEGKWQISARRDVRGQQTSFSAASSAVAANTTPIVVTVQ